MPFRLNSRNRISCALVTREKFRTGYALRQLFGITLELRGRDVGQVTSPARIIDANPSSLHPFANLESGQLRNDAIAHERAHPNRTIIRS